MQTVQPSPLARDHTFFGVCEAIGEDLGFSPVLLRIAFAFGLFFNPVGALAAYAGLGLLVLCTRFIAPEPRRSTASESGSALVEGAAAEAEAEPELALAARGRQPRFVTAAKVGIHEHGEIAFSPAAFMVSRRSPVLNAGERTRVVGTVSRPPCPLSGTTAFPPP